MKRVLIIHGWTNRRPKNHWHRNLAAQLRREGHAVSYPQMPKTDNPVLSDWLEIVEAELSMLQEVEIGELLVVGHSLGCLTWLHTVNQDRASEIVDRVLLVAPADPQLCDEAATFQLDLADPALRNRVHKSAHSTLIVESGQDPWLPRGAKETFGDPLQLAILEVPGAGHFSMEDNWSPWQGVINWIHDPQSDLSVR